MLDKKLIHVDIDIAEIGKNVRPDIEIEDDAADFFKKMLESPLAKDFVKDWQEWKDQLADKKNQYEMLKQQM